jgi:DNA polymerase-3 subunit epsilon
MTLLDRLLGRGVARDGTRRVVVVDTETRGLDPERDPMVAIGGVAVDEGGIDAGDSFEAVIADAPRGGSVSDIVVHGIGVEAQARGLPACDALAAYADWVGDARCVGFHAGFDRTVLRRAAASAGVRIDDRPWLDLATLAPVVAPARVVARAAGLDDWLDALGIGCSERHNAAGDALATAELYLFLRAAAAARGTQGFDALLALAGQARWLGRS